jgi:hypothetical protein
VRLKSGRKTGDGSWNVGYGRLINDGGTESTDTNVITAPAGTYSTPTLIDSPRTSGITYRYSSHVDYVQLAPVTGHLVLHETVQTPAHTCDLWVQSFPSS